MDAAHFQETFDRIKPQMARVVVGQEELVEGTLVAALAKGHVLVEGAPGLGKTLVARALAVVSGCAFKRIQFTPDLMPSDITGSSVFSRETGAFTFVPGPDLRAARSSPTRSTARRRRRRAPCSRRCRTTRSRSTGPRAPCPRPFVVIATQNPVESQGTYPLPEAQLDRFLFKLTGGRSARRTSSARSSATTPTASTRPTFVAARRRRAPQEIAAMQAARAGRARRRRDRRVHRGARPPHARRQGHRARGEPAREHRAAQGGAGHRGERRARVRHARRREADGRRRAPPPRDAAPRRAAAGHHGRRAHRGHRPRGAGAAAGGLRATVDRGAQNATATPSALAWTLFGAPTK